MRTHPLVATLVTALLTTACDDTSGDCTCPNCPNCEVLDDLLGADPATDAAAETDDAPAPGPTYWTAEATKVVDDLVFVTAPDPATGKRTRFFGIGFHPSYDGAWDGVTGANGCRKDPETGLWIGRTNDGVLSTHLAAEAGANFVYTWGYKDDPEYLKTVPRLNGIWHWEQGKLPAESEAFPLMACEHGETDMEGYRPDKLAELKKDYEDFKARAGRWASLPNLPPFEEMPWFCWHPTFRMKGGGDGKGEQFTDGQATEYARATNMMIADAYTYVCNRWNELEGFLYGQKGPQGECYDDWLAADDPEHRSYFSSAWDLTRSLRQKANPDAVVWMWMQGHAFDDDIGGAVCNDGSSTLWARGPFPPLRYLRKEIMSSVVAGGTGFVFFGYGYCRRPEAEKLRSLMRALSHPDVYGPALLSPRLDLGADLAEAGEGGRAHLMAKWHEPTRTAYLLGANPGAHRTPFSVEFPWTVAKVEVLDWFTPRFADPPADLVVDDRRVSWTAPLDDGFVLRVTPLTGP